MPTKTFDQFRQDNVVTTLPVSLPYGVEKYYKDPQGRLSLYIGDENDVAQLVGGGVSGTFVPTFIVDGGAVVTSDSISYSVAGRIATISGRLTLSVSGSPFDSLTISSLPVSIQPASNGFGLAQIGSDYTTTFYPLIIGNTAGIPLVVFDAVNLVDGDILLVFATYQL